MKTINKILLGGAISFASLIGLLNPNGNGRIIQKEKEKIHNNSITAEYIKYSSGNELLMLFDGDCSLCSNFKGDTLDYINGVSTKQEGSPILDDYLCKDSIYSVRNYLKNK